MKTLTLTLTLSARSGRRGSWHRGDPGGGVMTAVLLLLIVAVLILAWTPATGALAAVCCALVLWTVLCHLATPSQPKATLS